MTQIRPDDPSGSSGVPDYDAAAAARLARGGGAQLLQSSEPVFITMLESGEQRWSYVKIRIGFLAGSGWLVTYRDRPFDLRFAGTTQGLEPTARERLADAARDFDRTDQLAPDVATLMLRWLAQRHLTVAVDLGDEIARRMLAFHQSLVGEDDGPNEREARRELFDLRWVLDTHERECRALIPALNPHAEAWRQGVRYRDVFDEAVDIVERALDSCRTARRDLGEALAGWPASKATAS